MAFPGAFLRNNAINRVNLHSGVQALAQSGGGIFFVVFLVRSGVAIPIALLAMAGIVLVRLALRPAILPLARRFGIKPLLILGTLLLAAQYPLLAQVAGIGGALALLCAVAAVGEVFYWTSYNAYFAAIGDAAQRGAQIGAREALTSVAGIVAPLLGAWALVRFGPHAMFAGVGALQAAAALPLLGVPNVTVQAAAPRAFAAARLGAILQGADGWFDAFFIFVWQIALFASLGASFAAYGGAMALAGLVGAASGLALGHHVDAGHGRRAVIIAYGGLGAIVLARAASLGSPLAAVGANALGALLGTLMLPAGTAIYNLAKASPCPLRFHIATEGGWDVGCALGCLIAAALTACGVSLALVLLGALPPLALAATLLRRHYAQGPHDQDA
jgi:hypothetical protein